MKLKKVIPYLDWLAKVYLYDADYEEELLFEGSLMDIPWIYLDWTLVNKNGENAIQVRNPYHNEFEEEKNAFLVISIKEACNEV